MAGLSQRLDEEKGSNKKLRKKLREERAMHQEIVSTQSDAILELQSRNKNLTDRLKSKCAQIAEQNDELLQLRTEIADLTDRLKRARGGSGSASAKVARRKGTDGTD
jgi:chromosome segregation ATPase